MTPPVHAAVAEQRLHNQCITRGGPRTPARVVAWLGAVQAQEYAFAKWALGLRLPDGASDAAIERALDEGRILRTHVLRPTWHFVPQADIVWMLELTAPRIRRILAHYDRQLAIDEATRTRAIGAIERALGDAGGNGSLVRSELAAALERAGIAARGQRLAHLVMHAELQGVVCSGPRRGKQSTYALLAARAPGARRLPREEALAELVRRFFRSHGPATVRDFAWWSGLTGADAARGLEMNRARAHGIGGVTYWTIGRAPAGAPRPATAHLLPIYDEYLVAYRDRAAVPHAPPVPAGPGASVTFQHALVAGGQVAGTWRTGRAGAATVVRVTPLRRLTGGERRAIAEAAARYGRFLGADVSLSMG